MNSKESKLVKICENKNKISQIALHSTNILQNARQHDNCITVLMVIVQSIPLAIP